MEWDSEPQSLRKSDLTRLNAAEIEILRLLADGHTAKSIASLTGRSVTSVNERLRQSRRKTGVSSSRELARLLKVQKNEDEKIELGTKAMIRPMSHRRKLGVLVMTTTLFAAAVVAALTHQAPDSLKPPATVADPVLNGVLGSAEDHPFHLAQVLRKEQRDAQWATSIETSLRERFSSHFENGRIQLIKVTCATTVCEVIGKINESNMEVARKTSDRLQDHDFNELKGAKHAGIAFGPDGFASYWKRA